MKFTKITIKPALILTAALMAGVSAPSFAGDKETGGIIGAVVGGVIGNSVGGTTGAVIGAVAGGGLGVAVGNHREDKKDRQAENDRYDRYGYNGRDDDRRDYRRDSRYDGRYDRRDDRHDDHRYDGRNRYQDIRYRG